MLAGFDRILGTMATYPFPSLYVPPLYGLPAPGVQTLTAAQIVLLMPVHVRGFGVGQFRALSPVLIAAFTADQVALWANQQINVMTHLQVAALTPLQTPGLTTDQIRVLPHIASLQPAALAALLPATFAAMTPAILIANLTVLQVQAITHLQSARDRPAGSSPCYAISHTSANLRSLH